MSLSGKYTTIEKVIEQLHKRYGFDVAPDEIAEFVWYAMGELAVPVSFSEKYKEVTITDWKGKLPVNFYDVMDGGVREHNTKQNMMKSGDVFFDDPYKTAETPDIVPQDWDPVTGEYYHTTVPSQYDPLYYTYKISGGIITTGFRSGIVDMSYKAFPVDEKTGLPLIPDDSVYLRGIIDYIAYHVALKKMLMDELTERKFHIIEQKYLWSIGAARSKAIMPDKDEMERIRNLWKAGLSNYRHFDTGFRYLGSRNQ